MSYEIQKNKLDYVLKELDKLNVKLDRETVKSKTILEQFKKSKYKDLFFKHSYEIDSGWVEPVPEYVGGVEGEDIQGLHYSFSIYVGAIPLAWVPFIKYNLVFDTHAETQLVNYTSTNNYYFSMKEHPLPDIYYITLHYGLNLTTLQEVNPVAKQAKLLVSLINPGDLY